MRIQATRADLADEHSFLERMADAVREHNPNLADSLEKAAHQEDPPRSRMHHQSQQDRLEELQVLYAGTLRAILEEVGSELDKAAEGVEP